MPKLKLKFKDWIWIKWVDSDYSPDWEFYDEKSLLEESRDCQSLGLYLTQDKEVIAFCQSSDFEKTKNKTVVHAQTTIPWVAIKEIRKLDSGEQIYAKKRKKSKSF
jgi:hypothetical protein